MEGQGHQPWAPLLLEVGDRNIVVITKAADCITDTEAAGAALYITAALGVELPCYTSGIYNIILKKLPNKNLVQNKNQVAWV